MRVSFFLFALCACGARTELDVIEREDASTQADASVDHDANDAHDASDANAEDVQDVTLPEAPPPCDFGTVVADVFGSTVYWNGGAPLPAAHYRVTYVDGCMKYSSGQAWTVNAYADGPDTFFIVTDNATTIGPAPGTVGFFDGQGAFADFDACVSANVSQDTPFEFDFVGGEIGVSLSDNPYSDNVAGENGRSPTYRLSSCP